MTTATFATLTAAAAKATPPAGTFHGKAFIHAVWATGRFAHLGLSLDEFKALAWQAHREGRIELSRADMVEAMDPYDVRRSRLEVMGATLNFIRID